MSNEKDELKLDIVEDELVGVSIGEITLADDIEDDGITFDIGDDEDIIDDSESIIDTYITSLEEGKDASLTDITIEKLADEGNKANILAAGFKIDISTGGAFDADKMVENRIDMDVSSSAQSGLDINESDLMDDPLAVPKNFTRRELEGLAEIIANREGQGKVRELKSKVESINDTLRDNTMEEAELGRKHDILKAHVLKLGEQKHLLMGALADLEGLDEGRDTSATLKPKVRQGISAMRVKDELERVNREVDEAQKIYLEMQSRMKYLSEQFNILVSDRTKLQKEIQQVMTNLNAQNYVDQVAERYAKIVAVEVGSKHYSAEFRELPVFLQCQCDTVNMVDFNHMPRYVGIKITEYVKYKTKLQSYSREMMNNLVMGGLTHEGQSWLVCEGCKKDMMFSPSILQDFVKNSFAREVHAIEKHSKSTSTAKTPEDYLDSAVYYRLSTPHFPHEYLRNLGYTQYYESKTRTISTNPLDDLDNTLPLTEKEERIVRMFNPNIPEDMLNASMKSFNNLITSVNVFLDMIQKDKLKTKRNATSKSAIERNKINSRLSKFITEQRWLLVSYCVTKQMSIQEFKERMDMAHKSISAITKFQNELFDFFVEQVVESVVTGKDLVYVDSNRKTSLLEIKKRQLPHQEFFKRYRKLVETYFKLRSKTTKSLAQLKSFQSVLSGIAEVNKYESDELAYEKSEEIVSNILKDIDALIEDGFKKDFSTRERFIALYANSANKVINKMIEGDTGRYPDGRFYAWVAYEAKNNLLKPQELPTNESLYLKLYSE